MLYMHTRVALKVLRIRTFNLTKFFTSGVSGRVHVFPLSPLNFMYSTAALLHPVKMKLERSKIEPIFTPELNTLADIFKRNGFELRIAGGAVRDLLMDKTPHDLDFATTATPNQMKEMFEREGIRMINAKGEKHGTITPRINDKANFEVTTLRIDAATDGRHAQVEFTTDWQLDANRRDLTINCLFMDLEGTVYDYFNGVEDIKARRVVFVGDASTRIKEDYLRILRYFRFCGRIADNALQHEDETLQAIRENVSGLQRISGERIWLELKKILEGNFAGDLVKTMISLGVAPYIGLAASPDMEEFDQVWQRLQGVHYSPITLLAGMLRDLSQAIALHERLKFSAFERDLLYHIADYKNRERELGMQPLSDEGEHIAIRPYVIRITSSKYKAVDMKRWTVELLKYQGLPHLAAELEAWQIPRFPINGNIVRDSGCPGGKKMGMVMQELKVRWADSDFKLSADDLLALVPEILQEHNITPPRATTPESR